MIFLRHGRFALNYTEATCGGIALAWFLRLLRILIERPRYVAATMHGERVDDPKSGYFRIYAKANEFTDAPTFSTGESF